MSFDCQFFVEIRKRLSNATAMCKTESTASYNSARYQFESFKLDSHSTCFVWLLLLEMQALGATSQWVCSNAILLWIM
jgi:hypothetical protein